MVNTWLSEKFRRRGLSAKDFRGHVAIDDFAQGSSGCGLSVVQFFCCFFAGPVGSWRRYMTPLRLSWWRTKQLRELIDGLFIWVFGRITIHTDVGGICIWLSRCEKKWWFLKCHVEVHQKELQRKRLYGSKARYRTIMHRTKKLKTTSTFFQGVHHHKTCRSLRVDEGRDMMGYQILLRLKLNG